MRIPLVLLALGLVVVVAALIRGRLVGDGPTLQVRDVPRAIAALRQRGREHSFFVIMFEPGGATGAEAINLQLSIDHGRLGLDWVLISPANLADCAKVETYMRSRGHSVQDLATNGVRFLRVEDGDLTGLTMAILTDLYRRGEDTKVETVADGFELPQNMLITTHPPTAR
jgi:hypothetical protein